VEKMQIIRKIEKSSEAGRIRSLKEEEDGKKGYCWWWWI